MVEPNRDGVGGGGNEGCLELLRVGNRLRRTRITGLRFQEITVDSIDSLSLYPQERESQCIVQQKMKEETHLSGNDFCLILRGLLTASPSAASTLPKGVPGTRPSCCCVD